MEGKKDTGYDDLWYSGDPDEINIHIIRNLGECQDFP